MISRRVGILAALALPAQGAAPAQQAAEIDIPFEKFVLPNGLTLIVHEDHKAPIVAVNLWYHVGSKNEKRGRTGFAHLFEHLMFNGSNHYNQDYFQALEPIGATALNGTTNEDRTNYFQNVPTPALDRVLWLESDRMGHLLGVIDQPRLDEQRGVVQNEKRQGENQPYGQVFNNVTENTYPVGHPYSWPVIGSMEDLGAASLEDVREWFRTYYGAANAVIVIAGDIDAQTARRKVEHFFGDIPSGPPVTKQEAWVAQMSGTHRGAMQDRVPHARIYKVWNVPQWGMPDTDYLDLVADVLTSGKTSRLFKRLVYDERTATDVRAFTDPREISSQFWVRVTLQPGGDVAAVEHALDDELARLLAEGPTAQELERVKTQFRASFLRGIERIGGFGGKSDVLAESQVYGGSPDAYKARVRRVAAATAEDLRRAARSWLSDGAYLLEVHPFPQHHTAIAGADRSRLPDVGTPPKTEFPVLQRATLSNGLKIVLAERHSIPQVNFQLLVDAGFAADQFGQPGTASLTMNMLDEGTTTRNALQISEQLGLLGATLGTGANLDMSVVTLSALKDRFGASLEIFADVILNPSFPESDFQRLKRLTLAAIQQEKVNPGQMGFRVLPRLLYGAGHAYSNPLTGSGTEASVTKLTREELAAFHRTWLKPNNATLIVVGDVTLREIQPELERLFRDWRQGDMPQKNIGTVAPKPQPVVYLMDRPGSIQSIILVGNVAPPKENPYEIAIETLNSILGGQFISRINMNLREDKHWSYGVRTLIPDARGQRPFFAFAPVQTDKTKESVAELRKELRGIRGQKPVTAEELAKAQAKQTLTLPGNWETMAALGGSIAEIVRFGLDDRYYDTYADRVRALKVNDVTAAAKILIQPDNLVWVVIGDRSKIEAGIRDLDLGDIKYIDADGNLLPAETASQ